MTSQTLDFSTPHLLFHSEIKWLTNIVGCFYAQSDAYLSELPPYTALELIVEPTNPHDPHAIAVWHAGTQLGYIPKRINQSLASMLTANAAYSCVFLQFIPKHIAANEIDLTPGTAKIYIQMKISPQEAT